MRLLTAIALIISVSAAAGGQTTTSTMPVRDGNPSGSNVQQMRVERAGDGSLATHSVPEVNGSPVTASNPNPVLDANNSAFQGVVIITPGTPFSPGRSIGFVLSSGCTETITMLNGSTISLALQASTGLQTLPFAASNVSPSGCAGTFWNFL